MEVQKKENRVTGVTIPVTEAKTPGTVEKTPGTVVANLRDQRDRR